jgi:hypothetical protein
VSLIVDDDVGRDIGVGFGGPERSWIFGEEKFGLGEDYVFFDNGTRWRLAAVARAWYKALFHCGT